MGVAGFSFKGKTKCGKRTLTPGGNSMADWLKIATERFGRHTPITGNGPIAVRRCNDVVLCDMAMMAQMIVSEKCGAYCSHGIAANVVGHKIYSLAVKHAARERIVGRLDRIPGEGIDE